MASNGGETSRLRLVGLYGSTKIMEGELRRLVKRAFTREEAESFLNAPVRRLGSGTLSVAFSPEVAALVASYHRTAARVLWDLYETTADRLEPLYDALLEQIAQDERPYWGDAGSVRISVETVGDLPVRAGERQVVGTVKNALIEGARARGVSATVDPERPELIFQIRGNAPEGAAPSLSVGLDLAGRPLHQRGYRTQSGIAPLREDLAATLVMLSRFDPRTEMLFDPMAGSGTIPVEAALMAQGKPVWTSGRSPLLSHHPFFREHFERFTVPLFADSRPLIWAAEVDEETRGFFERAANTAGVQRHIQLKAADFRDVPPSEVMDAMTAAGRTKGVFLANPPYGARLEATDAELSALYRDLRDYLAELPGFRGCFLVGEPDEPRTTPRIRLMEAAFGGRARVHKPMKNGPMRASYLQFGD